MIDLTEWFTTPKNPIHIDIGCAKGRCIERLSQRHERAEWNHLGVEIRPSTVSEAIERVKIFPNYQLSKQKNLHYLACNFVASLDQLLSVFPSETLRLISIQVIILASPSPYSDLRQFPDPWRRKKHLKRMLVQEELVTKLAGYLSSGSLIYLSSDSNRVILWMIQKFLQSNFFKLIKSQDMKDLPDNVFFLPHTSSSSSGDSSFSSTAQRGEGTNGGACESGTGAGAGTGEDENEENEGEDLEGEETETENNEIEKLNEYWIDYNPLGELSERELICEVDWRRVKRCVLVRV
jgi:tRNA (guanine-N7-)-methyltransferase